jgi:2,4-dienoyl-CoA reductase-like NADH-dependent reductase (Old Yellow Enzyme family)
MSLRFSISPKIPVGPNYQVPFAEQIKSQADFTGAVGLINEAKQAEEIVASGKADMVLFARESLRDPNLALTFAHDLEEKQFSFQTNACA